MKHYTNLMAYQKGISALRSVESVVYWDQATVMPNMAAGYRGEQMAELAKVVHARVTSAEYSDLLAAAEQEVAQASLDDPERVNVAKLKRSFEKQKLLPEDFVVKFSRARVAGSKAWESAKKEQNFNIFAEPLHRLVEMAKEKAAFFSGRRTPYDVLLEDFEYGTTSQDLDLVFNPLKSELIPLIKKFSALADIEAPRLGGREFDVRKQEKLTLELLGELGFAKEDGYIATSSHPFSCTLGPSDFRITTRYLKNELMSSFMATAHEVGHSLYERGLPKEHFGTPLGEAASAGVHESQSLFWENRVARSRPFLKSWLGKFQEAFPAAFEGADAESFYRAVNRVEPGFIRVEADEVTYSMHIIIRYEIEKSLINEGLQVSEIPEIWNEKYKDYLGISPGNVAEGCLQDVHWSEALFGYFPSYALGHLMSAQLTESMEKDLGSMDQLLLSGSYDKIRSWLQGSIHRLGNLKDAPDLILDISGQRLSEKPFLRYLNNKFVLD